MEKKYWLSKHLFDQIKSKALFIMEAWYPGYELLFIFNNITSYAIYAKNLLQVTHINKCSRSQQLFLKAG